MSASSLRKESERKSTGLAGRVAAWEKEQAKIRTMWVVAVLFFWASAGFQVVLVILTGKANFILLSIIGGMMVLGVGLKLRLQRILRARPVE